MAVHAPASDSRAFTLMELILVMALLTAVIAVASPSLRSFISGRNVTEECRRVVALTRHARSEAVSRGQRMELWVDPELRQYGLRAESTAIEPAPALEFEIAPGIALEQDDDLASQEQFALLFWPDGTIDEESPQRMVLSEDGAQRYFIALADNRLEYVVETPDETP